MKSRAPDQRLEDIVRTASNASLISGGYFQKPSISPAKQLLRDLSENDLKVQLQHKLNKIRKYVTIDISADGHYLHQMSCADVIQEVDRAAFGAEGASDQKGPSLAYRDIRQIFSEANRTGSIEVRTKCILVCLPPLTGIIMYHRVILLVVEDLNLDNLIHTLHRLVINYSDQAKEDKTQTEKKDSSFSEDSKTASTRASDLPFEFTALETMLSATFDHLLTEVKYLEVGLTELETRSSSRNPRLQDMEDLHMLKTPVHNLSEKIDQFDRLWSDLLKNENDLKLMEITRFHDGNDLELDSVSVNPDLEVLLEYFDQEIDQLNVRIRGLVQKIDNIERMISLRLGLLRNSLIRLELATHLVGVGIALGTCISGIFGMNLENTHEDSHGAFLFTTSWIVVICAVPTVLIYFLNWFRVGPFG